MIYRKVNTNLSETLDEIGLQKAKRDDYAKCILADPQVLARIVKNVVTEFEQMSVEEIVPCIGEPTVTLSVPELLSVKNLSVGTEDIEEENGKIDGIVHSIAHANTEDLHNDFIYTSKNGYLHAMETSAYSLLLATRTAKEIDMLNEHSSIVTLTYHGSTKVINGYNVMGAAKAALEANVRYLAENLGKEEMRVNAISAGPIKTLSAKGIKDFSSMLTIVEEKAPLHKNVTTKQVGNVATFLLSNMSDAITGQVIYADNGYNIMGA